MEGKEGEEVEDSLLATAAEPWLNFDLVSMSSS